MPYAVFILTNDRWQLHCEFGGLTNARQERDYLVGCGVRARVFRREAL